MRSLREQIEDDIRASQVRYVAFGYTITLTPSRKGTVWYWSVESEFAGTPWSSVEATFAEAKEAAFSYRDALRGVCE
tara:strand:- start:2133 stop:2363 length:231 start_codon:yes stop_codon:yes gene_type:complete